MRLANLCCALLLVSSVAQAAPPPRHVIILTIDGMMPDVYLAPPEAHGLQVPTLRRLAAEGTIAVGGALSVFPANTYPAHASIATGANPGKHGIVTNLSFDPLDKNQDGWRWYHQDQRVPALYDVAFRAGVTTALLDWPVTVGADATWRLPEYWRAGTSDDVKLARALSTPGLVDEIVADFPDFAADFTPPNVRDAATIDAILSVARRHAPTLIFAHIWQTDDAQHEHGPWSPESNTAFENADAQVARLVDGLRRDGSWDSTVLIITSDHGFAAIDKLVQPSVALRDLGVLDVSAKGGITGWRAAALVNGGFAYIYVKDPADAATRAAVRAKFTALAADPANGLAAVLDSEAIRARGGDASAFLALVAARGFGMSHDVVGPLVIPAVTRGTHGYDPARPEMRASLIFAGPRIARGRVEGARLIDIAPTVAGWLGLRLPEAEGKALPVVLR